MQPSFLLQTSRALAAAAITAFTLAPAVRAGDTHAKDTITDEGNLITSITAKIESIDTAKRQLTLRGPLDNVVSVSAGKNVQRFSELKVGDYITADYYVSLALDVSMPDPDDMDKPITVMDVSEKAPADAPPGSAEFSVIRVIATVEGMDAPTQTLALRGPAGRHFLVAVKDVEDLKGLRLDDKVSVLCTQAVLISVDKASAADAEKTKRSADARSRAQTKKPGSAGTPGPGITNNTGMEEEHSTSTE